MARIGHVPEIIRVKELLEGLKQEGVVARWELPYENILTRLSAAIFFIDTPDEEALVTVCRRLATFPDLRYRENQERKLSALSWRLEFNQEHG